MTLSHIQEWPGLSHLQKVIDYPPWEDFQMRMRNQGGQPVSPPVKLCMWAQKMAVWHLLQARRWKLQEKTCPHCRGEYNLHWETQEECTVHHPPQSSNSHQCELHIQSHPAWKLHQGHRCCLALSPGAPIPLHEYVTMPLPSGYKNTISSPNNFTNTWICFWSLEKRNDSITTIVVNRSQSLHKANKEKGEGSYGSVMWFKVQEEEAHLPQGSQQWAFQGSCWNWSCILAKGGVTELHLDVEIVTFKPRSVIPHNIFMHTCIYFHHQYR